MTVFLLEQVNIQEHDISISEKVREVEEVTWRRSPTGCHRRWPVSLAPAMGGSLPLPSPWNVGSAHRSHSGNRFKDAALRVICYWDSLDCIVMSCIPFHIYLRLTLPFPSLQPYHLSQRWHMAHGTYSEHVVLNEKLTFVCHFFPYKKKKSAVFIFSDIVICFNDKLKTLRLEVFWRKIIFFWWQSLREKKKSQFEMHLTNRWTCILLTLYSFIFLLNYSPGPWL